MEKRKVEKQSPRMSLQELYSDFDMECEKENLLNESSSIKDQKNDASKSVVDQKNDSSSTLDVSSGTQQNQQILHSIPLENQPLNNQVFNPDQSSQSITDKPATPQKSIKSYRIYHDEALISFFRRLTFLIDGSMLVAPSGHYKHMDEMKNTSFIYPRNQLSR